MPELPEVEAARSAIAEHCIGKKIVKAIIADDTKVIVGVTRSDFEASILNKTIVAAHRKGKNMWLQLNSPPFPSFQFGMAGAVYIKGVAVTKYKRSAVKDTDEWPSKYSMFFIELDDGLELSFTDKRRFATVRLLDNPASVPPISALGPDALLESMTEGEFFNSLSKKKTAIKAVLLDQSFISGIGNWIADEVLYQARIHPSQSASSLSKDESSRLLKSIKEVIHLAVEVDADAQQFPFDWLFHFRWGKKPGKVDGKKIDFVTVGGRTTAYVPELQKLNGVQATKAPAKPRKQASKKNNNDDHNDNVDENAHNGHGDGDDVEEAIENAKAKQSKNRKGEKQPPKRMKSTKKDEDKNDDEEEDGECEKKATQTRNRRATAKRKSQETEESKADNNSNTSRSRGKKVKTMSKSNKNNVSDASDDDGNESKDQKKQMKGDTKKPQRQTKTKSK
ncbi:formamidopyrimidine-DNA glycosylase isoform X2 [Amaranthus tricolor]|uniref:formamidopyrimidine-DNA glycosylase isoform X2 n=1 Tax=Amaranthus tricolor TaxID=29722 RepID=UPI002586DF94|nr:formamidopyrimidine-DNA glycosylase isoform X2 [Amaranthus tricolor]